jgi:hypothetical protein
VAHAWRDEPQADQASAALDREEVAAKHYAELMRRVGHIAETGLAHQLARIPVKRSAVVVSAMSTATMRLEPA